MSDLFPYPGWYGKYLEDIKNLARGEVTWGEIRPVETGLRDLELWNTEGTLEFILSNPLISPMRKQSKERQLVWAADLEWVEQSLNNSLLLVCWLSGFQCFFLCVPHYVHYTVMSLTNHEPSENSIV